MDQQQNYLFTVVVADWELYQKEAKLQNAKKTSEHTSIMRYCLTLYVREHTASDDGTEY